MSSMISLTQVKTDSSLRSVQDGGCVWEFATGREVGRDNDYRKRHSNSIDWHGEDLLVTTCFDGTARLYSFRDIKLTMSAN